MADIKLDRIGWQDGTLVSKGKVEVNGTIYEVEPEQYSGQTPLSSANLKKMEDNTEKAINAIYKKMLSTNLYSTTSTKVVEKITLEDDVNNYDYIDITVTRAGQQTTHTSRIYKKDYGKKNSLLSLSTGSYLTIFALTITLKNTEISIVSGDSISFSNKIEGFANGIESIITDVIGYKTT